MRVAILEDDPNRAAAMRAVLAALDVEHVFHDNAPDMIAFLTRELDTLTLVSLDHDLGPSRELNGAKFEPGTGRDVADFLAARAACCPVLIHSSNGQAATGMFYALEGAGWNVARVVPFGTWEWVDASWRTEVAARLRPS